MLYYAVHSVFSSFVNISLRRGKLVAVHVLKLSS